MASTSQFISRLLHKFLDSPSESSHQDEIKLEDLTPASDPAPVVAEMDTINAPPSRSRQNSATATPKPSKDIPQSSSTSTSKPHYTVFIRLPFPRNGFQDPPPVEWDSVKDKALWKLISTSSNSKELNWEEMSARFNVSLPFLLQQAAWLYERHFDAMRAQMKKLSVASAAPSGTATPAPEGGVGGIPMSRGGSKDSNRPSYINPPRSPLTHGDFDSYPSSPRPNRIMTSRTPSTNTVTQARFLSSPKKTSRPSSGTPGDQQTPALPRESSQSSDKKSPALKDELYDDSDSEEETSVLQSQILRRAPLSKPPPARTLSSDGDAEDDEEGSSGGYLPFATLSKSKSPKDDQEATLRISPQKQNAVPNAVDTKGKAKTTPQQQQQQTQSSSTSSSTSAQNPTVPATKPETNTRATPLSPRQRAELEKLSPRYKNSGSEDSRSMGSSFSDLDDASVTQSALEDALMSNMQYGGSVGMASRLGGLKDALGR